MKASGEWDWAGAEREFNRALELNPSYAPAHRWYAIAYLAPLGRHQESIAEMQQARALDPVSLIVNTDLGWLYEIAGRDDLALAQYQKTLEMDASFVPAHFHLWLHYARCGMYKEAAAELKSDIRFNTGEESAQGVPEFQSASGFRSFLRLWADNTVEASKRRPVELYSAAVIYSLLGEKNRALWSLERACERREAAMIYLKVDPVFVNLRSDSRFEGLVRRIGLSR